ncbi:DNA-binding response regulator [Lentzea sp. NBRC 105346]|uniref:response regulator transcription factor n=1 Tax=Lentzea sp. NBRC 105346 TaxID=3032205 RepID=UPI0024A5E96D|nr:response regulator transcription factor [Lentzea sp. NBRC 105346]GLZ31905.1 DNA-binding response regulator [Lentzea sp. NBRC 105346]
MISLVLADDHKVFLEALETVLRQHGFDVVAVAGSVAALLQRVHAVRPDVCVADRHFTDGDVVEVLPRVLASGAKVLVLTADGDADAAMRALDRGVLGYVHKSRDVAALVRAIRRVAGGEAVVDVPAWQGFPCSDVRRLAAYLTPRERECLGLLVEGLGTAAMAQRLGVSVTTVRTHVQSLLTKLGVHSRLEAASLAVRHGLQVG